MRAELDARCEGEDLGGVTPTEEEARQWRTARAAILLMGDSGVRRDEAAHARRENLSVAVVTSGGSSKPSAKGSTKSSSKAAAGDVAAAQTTTVVWALTIIGKRCKQRTIPVSGAAVAALRAHWADREKGFDTPSVTGPLIAPVVINGTDASLAKHDGGTDGNGEAPYSADALARLVREAVRRLAGDLLSEGALSYDAHAKLLATSAHAFRHYMPFLTMSPTT